MVHSGKEAAVTAAQAVRDWATERGIHCADLDVWTKPARLHAAQEAARAGRPDLIVTIGGDGTFLRGVRVAVQVDALVLGIDVGRVGFLTEIGVPDLRAALDAVLAGEFSVDERLLLTMCASRPLTIPPGIEALLKYGRGPTLPPPVAREAGSLDPDQGVPLNIYALNDVVFEKLARNRQASVAVFVNGRQFASYSADGLIVSTPTGSTAYSFAAGGPVLSPHMDGLVFTPVAPHMSFNRSLVLGADERVAIQVLERSGQVAVSVDGALRGVLDPGDWISVYPGAPRARLARLADIDFLGRVRDRFGLLDAPAAVADGAP
ncbi:MAG TPA: NAD(+)/NADH kinase [Mycobacteriales bacterium]|nr:NAD(+)/NADH kinase [Mycobacteriales bacterium]